MSPLSLHSDIVPGTASYLIAEVLRARGLDPTETDIVLETFFTNLSVVTASAPSTPPGGTVTLTLRTRDMNNDDITVGGAVVVFVAVGGTLTGTVVSDVVDANGLHTITLTGTLGGTVGATTDQGDGTYTATFTGASSGTVVGRVLTDVDNGDGTHTITFVGPTKGMAANGSALGAVLDGEVVGGNNSAKVTVVAPTGSLSSFTLAYVSYSAEVGVTNRFSWTPVSISAGVRLHIYEYHSFFPYTSNSAEVELADIATPSAPTTWDWVLPYWAPGPINDTRFVARYELRTNGTLVSGGATDPAFTPLNIAPV